MDTGVSGNWSFASRSAPILGLGRASSASGPSANRAPPPAAGSACENAIVAKFVSARESADLDWLVALLTDDVFISMPPVR